MSLEFFTSVDIIGYLGGLVTVWGSNQKTMIPLRAGAVCETDCELFTLSNEAMINYLPKIHVLRCT